MTKELVIVESPAKARTIGKILGDDYVVLSSMGHVRDLPQKKLGVDVENNFAPTYQTNRSRSSVIQQLSKAIKNADSAYLATDPDREGEAIAWHLYELLKKRNTKAKFHRVNFHEITRQAVLNAFKDPGKIDEDLVDAQQARRVLDRLVGYQVSPLLWNQVNNRAKSAGRVQSVALRLICERNQAIEAFEPKEYWNFKALFERSSKADQFTAKLQRVNGEKVEIDNAELADKIYDDVVGGKYAIGKISKTPKTRRPGPPFITSTLQQAASTNLRFSAKQTMMLAQQLYEGIDTGSGPVGLITYMRTDSVNIATESRQQAYEFITTQFGQEYIPEKPNRFKSKKSAQEAHEAIRPTLVDMTPEQASSFLNPRQLKMYRLIWNRFISSQMAPAKLLQHSVDITNDEKSCENQYVFRLSSTETLFPGFLRVYNLQDIESDPADDNASALPPGLAVGEGCDLKELGKEQKFTEPPPQFSEGTLVRELEENGVGRPSTYAAIVATIQERDYVEKTKGRLIPTSLGKTVCNYLVSNIPELFEVKFTAGMEDELDAVEQGKLDWQNMIGKFYSDFSKWLDAIKSDSVPDSEEVRKLMAVFPESYEWQSPETNSNPTYDDGKFFKSLERQLDRGKKLTQKQWHALLIIMVRHEKKLPTLANITAELGLESLLEEYRQKIKAEDQLHVSADDVSIKLCDCLDAVKEWNKTTGKGNRVYDDKKFFKSLATQARKGKKLSDAQLRSLKNLFFKYQEQIENFEEICKNEDIKPAEAKSDPKAQLQSQILVSMAKDIGEWNTSHQKSGKNFDDGAFVGSLIKQFEQKSQLSSRKIYSLKKVITKYKDQITNFDERLSSIAEK